MLLLLYLLLVEVMLVIIIGHNFHSNTGVKHHVCVVIVVTVTMMMVWLLYVDWKLILRLELLGIARDNGHAMISHQIFRCGERRVKNWCHW